VLLTLAAAVEAPAMEEPLAQEGLEAEEQVLQVGLLQGHLALQILVAEVVLVRIQGQGLLEATVDLAS